MDKIRRAHICAGRTLTNADINPGKQYQLTGIFSVLLIKFRYIPIRSELDAAEPLRYSCHLLTEHFKRYILGAFDDELIVDVPTDEAVRECFHGIHQEVSGDGLHYILDKSRTITFKPLPFLISSDSFISDGFATKLILTDVRLDVC